MATPDNDPNRFASGIFLTIRPNQQVRPSDALVDLLRTARSDYQWPVHVEPISSQTRVMALESEVEVILETGDASTIRDLVVRISDWAGTYEDKLNVIRQWTPVECARAYDAVQALKTGHGNRSPGPSWIT